MSSSPRPRLTGWRRLATGYLLAQALLCLAWWGLLFTVPSVRAWFELMPDRQGGLDAFLAADLAVFVGGSAVGAWGTWRRARWATSALWFTTGGVAYASLYLVGWVGLERSAVAGVVPMAVASFVTGGIAVKTQAGDRA